MVIQQIIYFLQQIWLNWKHNYYMMIYTEKQLLGKKNSLYSLKHQRAHLEKSEK